MGKQLSGKVAIFVAVAVTAALATGCGGSSDSNGGGSSSGSSGVPKAQEPIAELIPAFERATSSPSCTNALAVLNPVALDNPQEPMSRENCPGAVGTLRTLGPFKASGSHEYGSAALVDGTAGHPGSLMWALDEQGHFRWTSSYASGLQIGSKPPAGLDFQKPVNEFVAALRADDCKAAYATIAPHSRLDYGSEKLFCEKYAATFTAKPDSLGSLLKGDSAATPVRFGTTKALGLFGIATKPTGYRTVIVDRSGPGQTPRIFDIVPGPPSG